MTETELDQAREQVIVLCRSLRHAEAMLAFNSGPTVLGPAPR